MMIRALLALVAVVALSACSVHPRERAFYHAVRQDAIESGLLEEYEEYVDKDPNISRPESREKRKATAAHLRKVLETERKAIEE